MSTQYHFLNILQQHYGYSSVELFEKLQLEIARNKIYYEQFETLRDLLKAVVNKCIDGKYYDFQKDEWVYSDFKIRM